MAKNTKQDLFRIVSPNKEGKTVVIYLHKKESYHYIPKLPWDVKLHYLWKLITTLICDLWPLLRFSEMCVGQISAVLHFMLCSTNICTCFCCSVLGEGEGQILTPHDFVAAKQTCKTRSKHKKVQTNAYLF